MADYYATYATYAGLMSAGYSGEREQEIENHRDALAADMLTSPDYHGDCLRNGVQQGLMLTRGGEANTYNVICRPGDQLYAGDIIDAFGEKWIVMEARADDTTHKTGVMHQCNHFFRWQNFDAEVHETWCYLRTSGYSAYINSDAQLQKSDEQEVLYLPYNEETEKIYVDKRLPLCLVYNEHGEKILSALKVTGVNPIGKSYNGGDHLLTLKVEAEVVRDKGIRPDNLDMLICDYIDDSIDESADGACDREDCFWKQIADSASEGPADGRTISVTGKNKIRIGRTSSYTAVVLDADGNDVSEDCVVGWSVVEAQGVSYESDGNVLTLKAERSAIVGDVIEITASYEDASAALEVEVVGFV